MASAFDVSGARSPSSDRQEASSETLTANLHTEDDGRSATLGDQDLLESGDVAGTVRGDRRFRPDVEGLRAVAIVLVVLFHGGLSFFSGGYVGVDVFFVISGFVITGVLLREREGTGRTSFKAFYGRRSRRIIPAATLIIITTVVATYVVLGALYGNPTAVDARWTSVFLANFHFSAVGTNYFTQSAPPSPLLNFWSLAVEEQFYLVYPAFFAVLALWRTRLSLRARLLIGLAPVVLLSFLYSVALTGRQPVTAYYSPFARGWELALGALVAVSTQWLLALPKAVAAAMSWVGLALIVVAGVVYTSATVYPGSAVAVPVLGAALVIAGGTAAPPWGAERVLGLRPSRWVGRISYSLYLWHWPILVLAAESAGKASQTFSQNVVWLLVAVVAATVTYRVFENPIRHAPRLRRGWAPLVMGAVLIGASLAVATVGLNVHPATVVKVRPLSPLEVEELVENASTIRSVPAHLAPSLAATHLDIGSPPEACQVNELADSLPDGCVFGDTRATRTMVIYGDSHALMWFDALNQIALRSHWRFVDMGKGGCPVDELPFVWPDTTDVEYSTCNSWQKYAVQRIGQLHPSLLIVTQEVGQAPGGGFYSPHIWQRSLEHVLGQLRAPGTKLVVLGNTPQLPQAGPTCMAAHPSDVQACSGRAGLGIAPYNQAEQSAATAAGVPYVDVTPWFCSSVCTPVVGNFGVYFDRLHITATYSIVLEKVLQQALGLTSR